MLIRGPEQRRGREEEEGGGELIASGLGWERKVHSVWPGRCGLFPW